MRVKKLGRDCQSRKAEVPTERAKLSFEERLTLRSRGGLLVKVGL